jgi:Ca2+-binding RTX toxin-like protein
VGLGGDAAGRHAPQHRESPAGDTLVSIENLIGSVHGDTLIGDGEYNKLEGGAGADYLDGGAGTDTVLYTSSTSGVNVNLGTGLGSGGEAAGDTLVSIENLAGSNYNDILTGDGNANHLQGGNGADTLYGMEGNDTLKATGVMNHLFGGAGDDVLHFDINASLLDGSNTVIASMVGMLDGGSGEDSLILSNHLGAGITLNFSTLISAGKVVGIEKIDITGDANDKNTLKLTASDVLAISDTDTLYVDGDANDKVQTTDAGWFNSGTVEHNGHTYNSYTATVGASTVHMYVDVDILDQQIVHP